MSRILLITLDFPPRRGGVARYLNGFARVFRDTIQVIAHPEKGDTHADANAEYPIEREPLLYPAGPLRWLKSVTLLRSRTQTYDVVVVSHVLPLGSAAWLASFFTGKPYVVMVHGLDVAFARRHAVKRWLATRVLRNAKFVVTNSRALEDEVKTQFGITRTRVVYPSVNPSDISHARGTRAEIRLLTVARLVPRKGHLRVIDAIAELRDRSRIRPVHYHIVGDGPMADDIARAVEEWNLADRVKIFRALDDEALARQYAQADIFVMPTIADAHDREGFGTVYLEAALYGIPSVATRIPGVDEAVIDGKTGFLVPDGDEDALVDALEALITDEALRTRLGSNARERVLAEFTPEIQFGHLRPLL